MGYYVVLDLEMCKVPQNEKTRAVNLQQEIIQIGAVLLNDSYEVIDEFNTYVKPQIGWVNAYISSLTGIKQKDVEAAVPFEEALEQFVSWMPEDEVEIVSWSENDQKQLEIEMSYKNVSCPKMESLFQHWTDSQIIYAQKSDNDRRYSLEEALIACDIETKGRAHDGFADAYNTGLLFAKMMKEPELIFNPYYENAKKEETEHLSCSLGDIFAGLNLSFG